MSEFVWTGEQALAIQEEGHALLEANAGTGKTTTVIGKIKWLLGLPVGINEDTGEEISPCPDPCGLREIAAITFTEKAAYDLKRKLRKEIAAAEGGDALSWQIDYASIGTIHAFCGELLREHALRLGFDPSFRVLDGAEAQLAQDELIKELIFEWLEKEMPGAGELVMRCGLRGRSTHQKGAIDFVRMALRDLRWHWARYEGWQKGDGLDRAALQKLAGAWDPKDDDAWEFLSTLYGLALEAKGRWEEYEARENVRDFDSLILKTRELLQGERGAAALRSLRRRYRIIIIDEFQDTDDAQRDIGFAIAGLKPGKAGKQKKPRPQLFFVGDPKQSIYKFRGADVSVWNDVKAAVCGARDPHPLTRNFRSDPAVVEFVNDVCGNAMGECDAELDRVAARARVAYRELEPHRAPVPLGGVDWMETPKGNASERRRDEARRVAARILQLVGDHADGAGGTQVYDLEERKLERCRFGDIAVLFRTRTGLAEYEAVLREYRIPYYLSGDTGLAERLEILDLLNVLRAIDNPRDDLRIFAYLRSPFVGLRDEVIARLQLDCSVNGRTLFQRAKDYSAKGEWYPASEHLEIVEIERQALTTGLAVLEEAVRMRSRWPLDRLLEEAIDRTGYRVHLELTDQPKPKLANIQRFLRLLENHREHTVGSFLELWARREQEDQGIPQAPLYSKRDNVVTLSTIHSAKGLEWPVVFLVDTHEEHEAHGLWSTYWSDRELGPIICPKSKEDGPRSARLIEREAAENAAERARLLYVAATRSGDRLIVTGPTQDKLSWHARWLAEGLERISVSQAVPEVAVPGRPAEPELAWFDALNEADALPKYAAPIAPPPFRFIRSATELMTRERSEKEWELRYRYGLTPRYFFVKDPERKGELPAWLRGVLIHDVLEQIQEEAELADLLDVTIGALDAPELEERLRRGTDYRAELEREIRDVISSEEWKWYTEDPHHRELEFVHLVGRLEWHAGAFDLYRPRSDDTWIIDFKTHDIRPDEVEKKAQDYRLQAELYSAAARSLGAGTIRFQFHFTKPNKALELPAS